MKKLIPFALLLWLIACHSPLTESGKTIFNANKLASSFHEIRIDMDTQLVLASGLRFFINKGAIESRSGNLVRLEIKEALVFNDIIAAGLTTTSNGEALSSAGMFSINTNDDDICIVKPIKVVMPSQRTKNLDMQVYKGEKDANGNINWVNPNPLPPDNKSRFEKGKQLFMESCAACHNPDLVSKATGPELAHAGKRFSMNWLKKFTHNSQNLISLGDEWANCVFNAFSKAVMNPVALSGDEIEMIYEFIEIESDTKNLPRPPFDALACQEECKKIQAQLKKIETLIDKKQLHQITQERQKQQKIEQEIQENLTKQSDITSKYQTNINRDTTFNPNINSDTLAPIAFNPNLIEEKRQNASYYTFDIDAFGWYNVDILAKQLQGTTESQLLVRLQGPFKDSVEVFLALPSAQIFSRGGKALNADEYAFYTKDGKVNLPQNATAWVYAFGEQKGRIFMAQQNFITSSNQNITLEPVLSNLAELEKGLALIASNLKLKTEKTGLDKLEEKATKMQAEWAKSEANIKKTAKEIEALTSEMDSLALIKPSSCYCSCFTKYTPQPWIEK